MGTALSAVRGAVRADPGRALLCLALALVIGLYAPSLTRGLSNYDDPWLVRDNWLLRDASWGSVRAIFTAFDINSPERIALSPEYLPIRDLSVMGDYAVWGDHFAGFHFTNLVLYLAAIALWFRALTAFGIARTIAGLAVLVWAVHPSHAESVAWVAERKGLLGVAFAGLAALGYARFRAGGRARWLVTAAVAAVCAVWSKAPSAFAIGALAGLELALPAGRVSVRRSLLGLGAVGAIAGAAFVPVLVMATRSAVVGTSAAFAPAGRAAMVTGVHGFYIELATLVTRNAVVYPISSTGPSGAQIGLGGVTLALILACALAPRRARVAPSDPLRAAAVLWLVLWFPFSHLVLPLQMVIVADRYALLPTLGFALAIAVGLHAIPTVRMRSIATAAVLVAECARTLDAQANWRDDTTLWARAVESNPADSGAWSQYAEALDGEGDLPGALAALAEGQRVAPAAVLQLRQALLLREAGDAPGALAAMRAAAAGGQAKAMSNLALLELPTDPTDALVWARRGALADPLHAPAHRSHGKVALAAQQPAEALAAFTRAYELEPGYLGNRYNLALALIALDRGAEARPHLIACLADPQLGEAARAQLAPLAEAPSLAPP